MIMHTALTSLFWFTYVAVEKPAVTSIVNFRLAFADMLRLLYVILRETRHILL